jgi:selenocysteine-specific elongation factor
MISLAEARDLFNTSRKYAQALLEHLDVLGVTARDGDFRRLRKQ